MRNTWDTLFPNNRVTLPAPYASLQGVLLDDDAFARVVEELPSGEAVDVAGLPGVFHIIGGGIRLAFPKKALGRPLEEVCAEIAAVLEKKWGEPFEAKKGHVWVDPEAGLRAQLYVRRVDGVFLEVCGYSPLLGLVQKLIDAARGKKAIPFVGDPRDAIFRMWPKAHDNESNVAVSVGLTELGGVPGFWHFEITDGRIAYVQLATDMQATSKKMAAFVKPLFDGMKARKDGKAAVYDFDGVEIRVMDGSVAAHPAAG